MGAKQASPAASAHPYEGRMNMRRNITLILLVGTLVCNVAAADTLTMDHGKLMPTDSSWGPV